MNFIIVQSVPVKLLILVVMVSFFLAAYIWLRMEPFIEENEKRDGDRIDPEIVKVISDKAPVDSFILESASITVGKKEFTHYYHFSAPAEYNADKTRSFPLVIYLHPWGPSNDPKDILDNKPYAPVEIQALPASETYPAFVYVPVCPSPYPKKEGPEAEWFSLNARTAVITTILNLRQRYNIDPSRIYLVGFSMGGAGSWYLGYEYHRLTGSRFAAVARGAGWYLNKDKKRVQIYDELCQTPSWIHVGATEGLGYEVGLDTYRYAKETFAKQEYTETRACADGLISDFKRLELSTGTELRLSVYRDRGHEDLMFHDSELIPWLFSQHR